MTICETLYSSVLYVEEEHGLKMWTELLKASPVRMYLQTDGAGIALLINYI